MHLGAVHNNSLLFIVYIFSNLLLKLKYINIILQLNLVVVVVV